MTPTGRQCLSTRITTATDPMPTFGGVVAGFRFETIMPVGTQFGLYI
jgi:hypothetical protein